MSTNIIQIVQFARTLNVPVHIIEVPTVSVCDRHHGEQLVKRYLAGLVKDTFTNLNTACEVGKIGNYETVNKHCD